MERSDWLLCVLYSPSTRKGKKSVPINGSVMLMKNLFLLWKEGNIELPAFYNDFVPYLYGPCSFTVYKDLDILKKNGLIDETQNINERWSTFRITNKGQEKIKNTYQNLADEIKCRIKDIKSFVNRTSFLGLLIYVYSKYPEYMTKSIIQLPRGNKD